MKKCPFKIFKEISDELNEKYPEGIEPHKQHLEEEGHEIIQKGKRFFCKRLFKEYV